MGTPNGTTETFTIKAKAVHGDTYDYSKVDYVNCRTNVLIVCKVHGDFTQNPQNHLNGKGCLKCGQESKKLKQSGTTEDFIKRSKEIHGNDTYNYSKVVYRNNTTKVKIICSNHGEFETFPPVHLKGIGCDECNQNRRSTIQEWIKKANDVHNGKYTYLDTEEYINRQTAMTITCPEHGTFQQKPICHLRGFGCKQCAINAYAESKRKTTDEFVVEAIKKRGTKFDYSKVNYINAVTKVSIICLIKNQKGSVHGEFLQSPHNHLHGRNGGCPKCNMCPSCELWMTNGRICTYCKPKNQNLQFKKTKEMKAVKYLKEKLPNQDFIHNRSVGKDCTDGHLFPDIRFDCEFYFVVVEIDEFKHRGASYSCDKQRMYDIIAKLGLPTIFIRYNPDSKDSNLDKLLEIVKKYLELKPDSPKIWDDYGFYSEYLFY